MGKIRKSAVQIRFEILEYLFFNNKPQRGVKSACAILSVLLTILKSL